MKFLAVASMAGLASGGYALASSATDANYGGSADVRAAHAPSTHSSDEDESSEANAPGSSTTAVEAAETTDTETKTASATPSPDLEGLCKAYRAHKEGNPDGWKRSAAFQVLITTAGGDDAVSAYCLTLIGPAATHAGKPTDLPGRPTDRPGPTSHPSDSESSGDATESESDEAPAPDVTDNAGSAHRPGHSSTHH
jgi:hypothetical protein